MSFLFRKNGSSRRKIRDKLSGRNSDKRKDDRFHGEGGGSGSPSRPPPPSPWGFLFPDDFVRIDGNLKAVIVEDNGLDVIYWRRLLELDNGGKIRNPRTRNDGRNRLIGTGERDEREEEGEEEEDEEEGEIDAGLYRRSRRRDKRNASMEEDFSFHTRKSRSSSSGGESRGYNDGRRYSSSASASPSMASTSTIDNYGAIGNSKSSSQTANFTPPSPPTQNSAGPSPPLPLPPYQATTAAPPPPPPPIPGKKGPPPPPPSKSGQLSKPPAHPKEPKNEGESSSASSNDPSKPKLKPLHWDKVNPDAGHSMVWHRMNSGSFNFDGDLMEALFGYVATKKQNEGNSAPPQNPIVSATQTYILEPRKSQNKAIVLKSLGITKEEMIDLLTEGHDADADTLEKLTRITPTQEEQAEILEFSGDPTKLADAESFLLHILRAVPSAFARFNAMLFKMSYGPEVAHHTESLKTLESACNELRARGLFMKLLEAVLKAGNRMNAGTARGNAQAFNLTALRKLSDVKSIDGKTTLLHFVVEEVVRSEGKRAAMSKNEGDIGEPNSENAGTSKEEQEKEYIKLGLPIVGGLSSEFINVKKAAGIDHDGFAATSLALSSRVRETRRLLDQSKGEEDGFLTKLRSFLESAEEELKMVTEEQARVMEFVKRTTNYYQAGASKDKNPFHIFVIIRDFLGMVEKVCSEIAKNQQKRKPATAGGTSASNPAAQRNAVRFPILPPNFMSEHYGNSSSDSDSDPR
ncbi:PREDICTED: formin-like protein 7 [Tarenaya hassleriana]|uniref:formin-like protein 7 n=1 Tax=Tarenaya hassleriana TaxID=28532 RepID=UPI00053CA4DB|nr:PREDICTED: formin-like protein 7 [Tarenaya hassleriana]